MTKKEAIQLLIDWYIRDLRFQVDANPEIENEMPEIEKQVIKALKIDIKKI